MKNALLVFRRDVKSIMKNPVAVIIVLGVCIIPSLYAWINIKACWNPYENTSTVPIAIVNNDKGAILNNKEINVGADVIKELKNNKKIGWQFVSDKEANLGLVDGTYYAMIEIPEEFSTDLTSLISGNIVKPEIIYKVQTKSNPVAVKIAGAAKTSLIDEVTSNFVETVNTTIFSTANEIGKKASENKDNIINLKDAIISLDKNMDVILTSLENVNGNATNINDYLSEVRNGVPQVISGLEQVVSGNEQTIISMEDSKDTLNHSIDNIQLNLETMKDSNERINTELQALVNSSSDTILSEAMSTLNDINKTINTMDDSISATVKFLENVNTTKPNEDVSNMIVSLKNLQSKLEDEQTQINKIQKELPTIVNGLAPILNEVIGNITAMNNDVITILQQYNTNVKPQLNTIIDSYITAVEDANYVIKESEGLVTEIDNYISVATDGSSLTAEMSQKLYDRLQEFKEPIHLLSEKLKLVNNQDLMNIVSILQSDPTFMGDFIAEPFSLKDEAIYEIPNYGSAMTPVYTVLALWVGGLMLTAVFKTEVPEFEGSENFTIRQKYFGKMITFVVLALIQGLIVSVGNKLLLGVYTVNTLLMILFALATSFTFSIIIYTLVAIFGNVGKALSIIFMIIQLAGSGGTYPIQVDPLIFRMLQPFFPFTYSIGGFREAIAGPLPSSVILDFVVLGAVSALFILFGYYLKEPLHPIVSKFEGKFKESGLAEVE